MALYKDMLEEKMRRFNELKEQEESVLKPLESLPISWKALDKVEKVRSGLQEIFEICYEDLYNSYEDYRLRETAKPEVLSEEPKPVWSIDEDTTWLLEEITTWPLEENLDEDVQTNSNVESDDDKEKKNVLKCTKCGETEHEPGAKFCNNCGAKFSEATNEEKEMEENGQLRIPFESEEEAEQEENVEVEENGQLRIPFENEEESESDER